MLCHFEALATGAVSAAATALLHHSSKLF